MILKIWFQLSRIFNLPVFSGGIVKEITEEVERNGFIQSINLKNTYKLIFQVGIPLSIKLTMIILFPYIVFEGLIPLFFNEKEETIAMIHHLWNFSYILLILAFLLLQLAFSLRLMVNSFHTQIRDEKYRIGVELNNYSQKSSKDNQEISEEKINETNEIDKNQIENNPPQFIEN